MLQLVPIYFRKNSQTIDKKVHTMWKFLGALINNNNLKKNYIKLYKKNLIHLIMYTVDMYDLHSTSLLVSLV